MEEQVAKRLAEIRAQEQLQLHQPTVQTTQVDSYRSFTDSEDRTSVEHLLSAGTTLLESQIRTSPTTEADLKMRLEALEKKT